MTETKSDFRAAFLGARRAVSPSVHDAEARLLANHLSEVVADDDVVCAYVPVGSEPGSIQMLDALHRRRIRVLLPVARTDDANTPQALQWGEYRPDKLIDARFGLREPAPPWLDAATIGDATLILVPALAVDRSGVRLGRGAGYYDRSLPLAGKATRRVAVVRDDEIVDRLPAEPHDVRMTHAMTPNRGLTALGIDPRE